jgi:hypothetical protein
MSANGQRSKLRQADVLGERGLQLQLAGALGIQWPQQLMFTLDASRGCHQRRAQLTERGWGAVAQREWCSVVALQRGQPGRDRPARGAWPAALQQRRLALGARK